MNVFARESGDVCKIRVLIYFHISDWKKHIFKSSHVEIVPMELTESLLACSRLVTISYSSSLLWPWRKLSRESWVLYIETSAKYCYIRYFTVYHSYTASKNWIKSDLFIPASIFQHQIYCHTHIQRYLSTKYLNAGWTPVRTGIQMWKFSHWMWIWKRCCPQNFAGRYLYDQVVLGRLQYIIR